MDKEKVFKELDNAKESQREIWIGYLAHKDLPKEFTKIFRIKNNYNYEANSLSIIPVSSDAINFIDFSSIINITKESDSIRLEVYEDKA